MPRPRVGNLRILEIILPHRPNIDQQNNYGMTALMIAAETGQKEVVMKLKAAGADMNLQNKGGNTALTLATKFGHPQLVSFFKTNM